MVCIGLVVPVVSNSSSDETLRSVLYSVLVPRSTTGLSSDRIGDWHDLCQCVPMSCQLLKIQFLSLALIDVRIGYGLVDWYRIGVG